MKTTFALLALLALGTGCRTVSPNAADVKEGVGRPVGEFRGAPALQQALVENVFDKSDLGTKQFQIARILGDGINDQKTLLGGNETDGDRFDYRGGMPNPLGVLLWYKTMKTLAQSFGTVCAQPAGDRTVNLVRSKQKPKLRPDVYAAVQKVCAAQPTDAELDQMWRFVVGFGLDEEKAAFKTELKNVPGDGAKRVEAMMTVLLMNPCFLLQQQS